MPFPVSLIGSFNVKTSSAPDQFVPALKTAISNWLVEKRARDITQTAQRITFKAGMFRFVWSWNPLVAISSGEIDVLGQGTDIQIAYHLRFTEAFIIVTTGIALIFGPPTWNASNLNAFEAFGILSFAWLWLFGMNYLFARIRVLNALKQIARQFTGGVVS